ncbi:MAG TPA: DUF1800 family protein [Pseudomonadota bacterium]|nr:DUF1800 domain-containing protein [Xanthomonadales bacterium]HQW80409.1 DUF1800 family protein [Pseudomonadota bacterium]
MSRMHRIIAVIGLVLASQVSAQTVIFTGGFEPPPGGPGTDQDAMRFLTQATFGPTMADFDHLNLVGIDVWLNDQLAQPFSRHRPYLDAIAALPEDPMDEGANDVGNDTRNEVFFERAMHAPDQLRQRVAFALSEILVVSDQGGGLAGEPYALAHYYDLLGEHGFGNYRELLEQVTLSPVMGHYLSMFGNRKPDLANNIRPDENYAREIMQLFSIGLVRLNSNGTDMDDPNQAGFQTIPTFNQQTIQGFAHVFTGFTFTGCEVREFEYCSAWTHPERWFEPMSAPEGAWWDDIYRVWHAYPEDKQLLVYPGVALANGILTGRPAPTALGSGVTAQQDLEAALDNVFNHPNVGPFFGRQLIQRLVTSNPSPTYVSHVAAAFNNNGLGVRGDMKAVIRAVLTDPEARGAATGTAPRGKLREPLLRMTQLWRAFDATDPANRYNDWFVWWPGQYIPQSPLHARTVFNFFLPDYKPAGEITAGGWVAPEFQIQTDGYVTNFSNVMDSLVWNYAGNPSPWADADATKINIEAERLLAGNATIDAMIERLNLLLMSGSMSTHMKTTLRSYLLSIPAGEENGARRVWEALWMIMVSPEFVIEK